jgi:cytidylate kinase
LEANLPLKKNSKFHIAADGSAASGKTTGAKLISKVYKLKFLSSGLLYRYASYLLIKNNPKNKIRFLKLKFSKLNYKFLNKLNLQTTEISDYTSILAKEKKVRNILKNFQKKFAKHNKRICIEGRDIGTVILPQANVKFFFKCNLNTAALRRYKELRKKNKKISLAEVKKSIKSRNKRDISRKNSPLLKSSDAIIVDTGKLKNIKLMVQKMKKAVDAKLKVYGR